MSYAIDVNVLLFASDTASPHNARAVEFLTRCASDSETLCLGWPTLMGYLRMATHSSIFGAPLSVSEAQANVESLIGLPHARVLSELDTHWRTYCEITVGSAVRGNAVPDAHLAALLRQHGVKVLYTNDSDFRRFAFLDCRDPFS